MSELSETVEMATLDKEMAEEKAETLQLELDACKEKIEELTLDLDIIKAEIGDGAKSGAEPGSVTQFELKALQAQNEKLRESQSPQDGVLKSVSSSRSPQVRVLKSESSSQSPQVGVLKSESSSPKSKSKLFIEAFKSCSHFFSHGL